MNAKALIRELRRKFAAAANAERARQMQAYMKSEMPYYGIPAPLLRTICRETFAAIDLSSREEWQDAVLALWRGAKFREERYAAIGLCADRRAGAWQTIEVLPMYEEMIVSGAWWDTVDAIATNRLGELLRNSPREMRRQMLRWSTDQNLWKRRGAILCQLKFKTATDLDLLYRLIEPSLASKEFFLRKAIGWALRQYAWTDAAEVRRYVRENEARLSGLTKREALKNIA